MYMYGSRPQSSEVCGKYNIIRNTPLSHSLYITYMIIYIYNISTVDTLVTYKESLLLLSQTSSVLGPAAVVVCYELLQLV